MKTEPTYRNVSEEEIVKMFFSGYDKKALIEYTHSITGLKVIDSKHCVESAICNYYLNEQKKRRN